jgi:hypothetical protein
MHRAPEEQAQSECEWKRGKGVSSWIAGALVPTLALTREAFSWKPFVLCDTAIRFRKRTFRVGPRKLARL